MSLVSACPSNPLSKMRAASAVFKSSSSLSLPKKPFTSLSPRARPKHSVQSPCADTSSVAISGRRAEHEPVPTRAARCACRATIRQIQIGPAATEPETRGARTTDRPGRAAIRHFQAGRAAPEPQTQMACTAYRPHGTQRRQAKAPQTARCHHPACARARGIAPGAASRPALPKARYNSSRSLPAGAGAGAATSSSKSLSCTMRWRTRPLAGQNLIWRAWVPPTLSAMQGMPSFSR